MTSAHSLGAAVLLGASLLAPWAAQAQQTIESLGLTVTTTPLVATDYLFRGISQTRDRPAIQGTLDVEHESGIYVGAFLSNAMFAGTNIRQELDGFLGYRFQALGAKFDLGAVYFAYPGYDEPPGGFSPNWWELQAKVSYEIAPFKLLGTFAWSPDYNFESGNGFYLEGGVDVALPYAFTLSGRLGYQWIDRNFASVNRPNDGYWGAPDYMVGSVAVSREIVWGFIGTVGFSFTNLSQTECFGGQKICDNRVYATISRPF
ncbi:TorF family putative porin [Roseomonas sp. AR75]|uniref:TorF family putative porin n=1 Tax=Roseomonas sp. AR75 TaxID=2562311 RepID=UPI0010C083A3|nr:TorF family putative porin [Roseomonas sp. AR75]